MYDGPQKKTYLKANAAGRITQRAMLALDRIQPEGSNSAGVEALFSIRFRTRKQIHWKTHFDVFFKLWLEQVIGLNIPIKQKYSNEQPTEGDLNTLTWNSLQKASDNLCRELWSNNLVQVNIEMGKTINFGGLVRSILLREMRWAVPSCLLGIGRDNVFRLFKALEARRKILKNSTESKSMTPDQLFKEVAQMIGVNKAAQKNNLRSDMERYQTACGHGPEITVNLSEADFFDLQSADLEQRDNFGTEDGYEKSMVFGAEFRRIIRNNIRVSNHPAMVNLVDKILRGCLKHLEGTDAGAHEVVRQFMRGGEDIDLNSGDPLGLLDEALRRLKACLENKLKSDLTGSSSGDRP